jgi:hypothetical protein
MFFRRPPPIRDAAELAQFIDENAAFVTQKGIYEYARARSGHYAKVLLKEPDFLAAVENARWRAYPLTLAMVAELVEGTLAPSDRLERQAQLDVIHAITLAVFDRYPVPAPVGAASWGELRAELDQRLKRIAAHPPKWVKDIPESMWEAYFELMPIHHQLKAADAHVTRNYLRVTLINVHIELTKRLDVEAVRDSLRAGPIAAISGIPPATVAAN